MDLYSRLHPSSKLGNASYHLVQLSSDLLQEINRTAQKQTSDEPIPSEHERLLLKYDVKASENFQFKSIDDLATPYLTTPTSTYKLRQQNHSNCVMLLHDNVNFLNFDSYLIMERQNTSQLRHLKLNLKDIPIIELKSVAEIQENGKREEHNDSDCLNLSKLNQIYSSCKKLLQNTPMSISEFDTLILETGYIPHYDSLVKIHTNLETMILNILLTSILETIENINSEMSASQAAAIVKKADRKITDKFKLEKNHLLVRIITNVFLQYVRKRAGETADSPIEEKDQYIAYSLNSNGGYTLIHNKIIKFLTMTILEKEKNILLDDLLIQIRLNLPVNYLPSFEINEILNGFSYTQKQENGQLQINYLTVDQLSIFKTPQERFSKLFSLKSQWMLEEIQPFVSPLNTKGTKIDKFCLKFCRVKKAKNKTVLMRR